MDSFTFSFHNYVAYICKMIKRMSYEKSGKFPEFINLVMVDDK
jgi:hypothetical protein